MPRNTLLDPQNVIATWGGDEEKVREESVQLKALKQKYDKIHQVIQDKHEYLKDLKRQLQKAGEEEAELIASQDSTADSEEST